MAITERLHQTWVPDQRREANRPRVPFREAQQNAADLEAELRSKLRVAFMAAMWSTYTIGALLGAVAVAEWERYAAVAALIVLLVLVTIDRVQSLGGHEPPAEPHPIF